MDTFESPDGPPHLRPSWEQPLFVLPATVAVDLLVIHTDQVAVTIGPIRTYPTGFEFTIDAHLRRGVDLRRLIDTGTGPHPPAPDRGPQALRMNLEYADGRRGDSAAPWPNPDDDVESDRLVMAGGGADGSQYNWHSRYWVHPLPSSGPVRFHIAWPAHDIAETHVEIDGSLIREAATRAITLWPSAMRPEP